MKNEETSGFRRDDPSAEVKNLERTIREQADALVNTLNEAQSNGYLINFNIGPTPPNGEIKLNQLQIFRRLIG